MMETVVRVLTLCGWWEEQVTLYSDHLSYSRVRLFVTQWAITLQAPLSLEFSRQEYGSGLPCPPPGDLPNLEIEPASPAWKADSLPLSHQGSPDKNTSP